MKVARFNPKSSSQVNPLKYPPYPPKSPKASVSPPAERPLPPPFQNRHPNRLESGEKWYHRKTTETGWEKDMPTEERRNLMLDAHGGDYLSAARALQALANVTRDRETKAKAASDAVFFYTEYKKYK